MALEVVLHNPAIPNNTGNIIRTTACTGANLHIIEPLGFSLDDTHLKRAGLDYHDLTHMQVHPDFDSLFTVLPSQPLPRIFAFSSHANTRYDEISYQDGDVLLFGTEPTGLPPEVINDHRIYQCLRIPMLPGRRSLNLSNSVAIAIYEAWRQLGWPKAAFDDAWRHQHDHADPDAHRHQIGHQNYV